MNPLCVRRLREALVRRWSPRKLFDEHPAERPRLPYRVKRRRDGSLAFRKQGKPYRLERDEQAALVQWALNHPQDVMDAWENHIHFYEAARRLRANSGGPA